LTIIPVINKIDLPAADPSACMDEVEELLIMEKSECILASAKNGIGVAEILEAIVERIPPPQGHRDHLGAGVQRAVRSVSGRRQLRSHRGRRLQPGTKFMSMAHQRVFECTEVGVFGPEMRAVDRLEVATSAT